MWPGRNALRPHQVHRELDSRQTGYYTCSHRKKEGASSRVLKQVRNPGLKLRPGMTASVSITAAEVHDALLVPNAALHFTPSPLPAETSAELIRIKRRKGKQDGLVWTQDTGQRFKPHLLRLGLSGKSYSEVRAGDAVEGRAVIVGSAATAVASDRMFPGPPPMFGPPPPPPPPPAGR
jgi:multidrug efflux pump subunit AcrA (membrane-fusion protein)